MSEKKGKIEAVSKSIIGKKKLYVIGGILLFLIFINTFIVMIDSGEIGVPVLFGKVQKDTIKEGFNIVNPFVKVVRYPVRIQEYTMLSKYTMPNSRQSGDDSITIKTSDGLNVKLDMTVWWYVNKNEVSELYRNIAKHAFHIEPKILRPAIRTVVRDVAVKYTMDGLYTSEREEFVRNVSSELKKILTPMHIIMKKVLIRTIILPKEVEEAISRKMKTKQQSQEMEFKKTIATQEAEIREIEAKGLSKRQEIINQSLTPLYVQYRAIEIYKELVNSKNSTFIVMPTSSKGTGMPLIIDAKGSNNK